MPVISDGFRSGRGPQRIAKGNDAEVVEIGDVGCPPLEELVIELADEFQAAIGRSRHCRIVVVRSRRQSLHVGVGEVTEDVLPDRTDWNAGIREIVAGDRLPGNGVVDGDGNLLASGIQNITLRKIARAFKVGRHLKALSQEVGFAESLLGKEEEGLVGSVVQAGNDDRAADGAGIAVERRIGTRNAGALGEEIVGVVNRLACNSVERAVQVVGARLEQRVIDAAARSSHFRIVRGYLNLELLGRLGRGNDRGPVDSVGDGHAVDQVLIGGLRAACNGHCGGIALVNESGTANHRQYVLRDIDDGVLVAPVARGGGQVKQLLLFQCRRGRAVRRIQQRGGRRYFYGLRGIAQLECNVHRDGLLRADVDAPALEALEARVLDYDAIGGRVNLVEGVESRAIGNSHASHFSCFVDEGDLGSGDNCVAGVGDQPAHFAVIGLGEERH